MADILAGLSIGAWALLAGWVLPSAVAVAAIYGLLAAASLAHGLRNLDVGEQALLLAFITVSIGLVLSAVQVLLYRILEGYIGWPAKLRDWRIERHRAKRKALLERLHEAEGLEYGLLLEQVHRYPTTDPQVAPTRLGNAIRALEVYGWDHYRLDSQTVWSELLAVGPAPVRDDLSRARVTVDFCVASLYLSLIVGAGLVVLAVDKSWWWLLGALAAIALVPLWYELAARGTDSWYSAVQALVDLGRIPLAQSLGLVIPSDIKTERKMWESLMDFVGLEYEADRGDALGEFRARPRR